MSDDTNPRARAIGALAELFFALCAEADDFEELESRSIDAGHDCMAQALAIALEALDAHLLAVRPSSYKVHDIRPRVLATEIGDVSFSMRRYRDLYGCDTYLLAERLDIAYNARISPGARAFLVEAAAHVSYAKAAGLLGRHGSNVKATTAMKAMRDVGALCRDDDEQAARRLYGDGVVPQASSVSKSLCVEADGTYFSVQRPGKGQPRRLEVKAMVAYGGKETSGGKVKRIGCVHHAMVGPAQRLWSEGVAAMGARYDLAKLEEVHLGADGERWCRDAQRYLPHARVITHLDPFHLNRAVLSCFYDPKAAWKIVDVLNDGDTAAAVALLRACADLGVARKKRVEAVAGYIEGNSNAIGVAGPTLGTAESDNQHLYGVRMDSFPCAWSIRGASDMARIISRRESGRAVPKMTREASAGRNRKKRHREKELAFYEKQGGSGQVVESVGSGYLPPHQADTRKMDSGKAYALYRGMANLDKGI